MISFLELYSTLSEKKDFCHGFSFFNRFTTLKTPYPLNSQNLLDKRDD